MTSFVFRICRRSSAVAALTVGVVLFGFSAASATLPGRNGGLAFSALRWYETSSDYLIAQEYLGFAPLRGSSPQIFAHGVTPAFSPDGRSLATRAPTLKSEGYGSLAPTAAGLPAIARRPRAARCGA